MRELIDHLPDAATLRSARRKPPSFEGNTAERPKSAACEIVAQNGGNGMGTAPEQGFWFWGSIGLVVAGNVAYHLGLKQVPRDVHPLAPLFVLFATAALTALAAWPFAARGLALRGELGKLNLTPFVVGVAIVGIELGFLTAYRSGWKISAASLTANLVIAAALVAIGVFGYNETVSGSRLAGLALCVAGLWLLNRG
jgi:multidrug transporter EmrE-like cation transporter